MARLALPLLLLTFLLAGAAPASAQENCDDPGDGCPLVIEVDTNGFVEETLWVRTADEWANITLANDDEDNPHTVTIADFGVSLTAEPMDEDWMTVLLDKTGEFEVRDTTTGKTATLKVVPGDAIDDESSAAGGGGGGGAGTTKGQPGLGLVGLVAAAALAAMLRRRMS